MADVCTVSVSLVVMATVSLLPLQVVAAQTTVAAETSSRQPAKDSTDTPGAAVSVTLLAPEPLRARLIKYLDLPVTLTDASERASSVRRVRRDVADILATEGYYSPTVDIHPTADAGVVIDIDPGKPTRVASVDLQLNGALSHADAERWNKLKAAWALHVGDTFRSTAWDEAKAALLAQVMETDYAAAKLVDSRAEVDPEDASVRLTVVIDSGPAYRFGTLSIDGLKRYDESLVRKLAPYTTGAPYRRDALLTFQSRLQNTLWFHSVMVEANVEEAVDDVIPVRVVLREMASKSVSLGLGYGTNSGARSEISYRDHDFLGGARDLNSGVRLEENEQTAFADLGLLADDLGYRLAFGAKLNASDIQGLRTTNQSLGVTRSRSENHIETRLGLEWQREDDHTDDTAANTARALALDWRWIRRAVDDASNPRRGNVLEVRLGGATRYLASDANFLRSQLRFQQWWPVGGDSTADTLSLRGELGYTAARSTAGIPQEYLFRTGGAQSVRGYAYQSIGLHDGNAVVGGRSLLTGSIEYTHWFNGPWGAAIFVDAGDVADRWQELHPAVGSGIGARWKSPAGPLAIDLARGVQTGKWHLHFSLMVAF